MKSLWIARRTALILLVLFAAAAFLFITIASEIRANETQAIDNFILRALRTKENPAIPLGPPWLFQTVHDISALGGWAVLTILTIVVSVYLAIKRRGRLLAFFLCSTIGGTLAMSLLKTYFARPRPSAVPFLTTVTDASFPSGHSMLSAIVYLTLGAILSRATPERALRIFYFVVAVILSLLIGLSRIYLGVHHPSDVLAGWCAAIMWGTLSYLIAEWFQRRGVVEPESSSGCAPDT